jgi:hypothetical protein
VFLLFAHHLYSHGYRTQVLHMYSCIRRRKQSIEYLFRRILHLPQGCWMEVLSTTSQCLQSPSHGPCQLQLQLQAPKLSSSYYILQFFPPGKTLLSHPRAYRCFYSPCAIARLVEPQATHGTRGHLDLLLLNQPGGAVGLNPLPFNQPPLHPFTETRLPHLPDITSPLCFLLLPVVISDSP